MPIRLDIERLRAAAKQHGALNDAAIAAKTKVSASTISRLARPNSEQEPMVATFRALSRPFGLTVDDLILDEDDETHALAAA